MRQLLGILTLSILTTACSAPGSLKVEEDPSQPHNHQAWHVERTTKQYNQVEFIVDHTAHNRNEILNNLNTINAAVKQYEGDKTKLAKSCIDLDGSPKKYDTVIERSGFLFKCDKEASYKWLSKKTYESFINSEISNLSMFDSTKPDRNVILNKLNSINAAVKQYEGDKTKLAESCIAMDGSPKKHDTLTEHFGILFKCDKEANYQWLSKKTYDYFIDSASQ